MKRLGTESWELGFGRGESSASAKARSDSARGSSRAPRRISGLWSALSGSLSKWARPICLLMVLSQFGCGYQLVGRGGAVPGDVRSVHIGVFENRTREIDLDEQLVLALEREFYRRGVVAVKEGEGEGEAVVRGAIRRFRSKPVAFDANDEALQYEVELTIDAILERPSDGAILWRGSGIQAFDTYSVRTDTVVPSSSRFQRGRVEFGALDDLTPIQLAETERRLAIERMVQSAVRDIYERMLDDF